MKKPHAVINEEVGDGYGDPLQDSIRVWPTIINPGGHYSSDAINRSHVYSPGQLTYSQPLPSSGFLVDREYPARYCSSEQDVGLLGNRSFLWKAQLIPYILPLLEPLLS